MKTLFYLGNVSHTTQLFTHILHNGFSKKISRQISWLLMKNQDKHFPEACHKKNCQVTDGEHDSTIFPTTFSLGGYK